MVGTMLAQRLGMHRAVGSLNKRVRKEFRAFFTENNRVPGNLGDVMDFQIHHRLVRLFMLMMTIDLDEPGQGLQIAE